jgi:hypothetical protein
MRPQTEERKRKTSSLTSKEEVFRTLVIFQVAPHREESLVLKREAVRLFFTHLSFASRNHRPQRIDSESRMRHRVPLPGSVVKASQGLFPQPFLMTSKKSKELLTIVNVSGKQIPVKCRHLFSSDKKIK